MWSIWLSLVAVAADGELAVAVALAVCGPTLAVLRSHC
jgi:hypothetical protein